MNVFALILVLLITVGFMLAIIFRGIFGAHGSPK